MARAGRARVAYLRAYTGGSAVPQPVSPTGQVNAPQSAPEMQEAAAQGSDTTRTDIQERTRSSRSQVAANANDELSDIQSIKPTVDRIRMQPDWQKIEITEAKPHSYSLNLWYRDSASPMPGESEADTTNVARVVLSALVKSGREPAKESVNVMVSAMRPVKGETGTDRVQWYGYAAYNYNYDHIEYKTCNPRSWLGC